MILGSVMTLGGGEYKPEPHLTLPQAQQAQTHFKILNHWHTVSEWTPTAYCVK